MENETIHGAELSKQASFYQSINDYQNKLDSLRAEGVTKIKALKNEIRKAKLNKELSKEDRDNIIAKDKEGIEKAKEVVSANAEEIGRLQEEAVNLTKSFYSELKPSNTEAWNQRKQATNEKHDSILGELKAKHEAKLAELNEKKATINPEDKDALLAHNNEVKLLNSNYKQAVFEENNRYRELIQEIKNEKHAHFLQEHHLLASLRDGKNTIFETIEAKWENYGYLFNWKDFLTKNGLYIIIVLFLLICICLNSKVANLASLMLIMKTFSYKVFFALGVAGLILLAGTDLSVGRMVTMSTLITCMILNPTSSTPFFGANMNGIYASMGVGGAAIVALLLSILFCVVFSMISGFFSAKFKIHPFISTMAMMLVIWGLMAFGTKTTKTGAVSSDASKIVAYLGSANFPVIFFYAVVAILIVSFIWNRTKFGKYLYAVGGNPDAAAVSGISVFWVTMGAFIMAGVLYGFGGFITGLTLGSADINTGLGWEMEAIAACVVGGISFMGGIGKISGAVMGCALFEILKTFLNGVLTKYNVPNSTDIANIFIGVIILTAVTFDSLKYLKKK